MQPSPVTRRGRTPPPHPRQQIQEHRGLPLWPRCSLTDKEKPGPRRLGMATPLLAVLSKDPTTADSLASRRFKDWQMTQPRLWFFFFFLALIEKLYWKAGKTTKI